jgi:hypothetical protein
VFEVRSLFSRVMCFRVLVFTSTNRVLVVFIFDYFVFIEYFFIFCDSVS